ncbi:MAG: 3'(2'),5'-bisphosphate nucleotidase CysQ, partial [Providencia alcalifaciens]|nr:3'(2'),5'-bisphosphate nucleotidase CysQ [Providencia alcalifaciens]
MRQQLCTLAREAGDAIMKIYNGHAPLRVEHKQDDSPVTAADIAAHQIIKKGLSGLSPDIPQLSEEDPPEWSVRRDWQRYWLIDPLDGTKEFINRNGDFTVNIALIENGIPVMG